MDGSLWCSRMFCQRHTSQQREKYPKSYMSGMGIKWRDIENITTEDRRLSF